MAMVVGSAFDILKVLTYILHREAGFEDKKRDYLPSDKQFLVTRNGIIKKRLKDKYYIKHFINSALY
jgi:hypothetical protein